MCVCARVCVFEHARVPARVPVCHVCNIDELQEDLVEATFV